MHTTNETKNIKTKHHRLVVQSIRANADARRSISDKFADNLTVKFGTVVFLVLNAVWFFIWIAINTRMVPGVGPFDPFPFGLLTMIVSLEAIFLAIIVLISQNRAAKIAELREEIDLQINSIAETEISKTIMMLGILLEKNGIKLDDPEIAEMVRPIRSTDIQKMLEKQLK
ncbi:MAG: DUF1003 domain-containing protein [bacterium]|nr:DUF1003 domain-containing protein [bacterium]